MRSKRKMALSNAATPKNTLLLGLLFLIMTFFIMPEAEREIKRSAYGIGRLPASLFGTPEKLYEQIGHYGAEGRTLYVAVEMSADIFYAIVIALLLASAMISSSAPHGGKTLVPKRLQILPVVSILLNAFGSTGTACLLINYPHQYHFLPLLISLCFKLNLLALLICTGVIVRNIYYLAAAQKPRIGNKMANRSLENQASDFIPDKHHLPPR